MAKVKIDKALDIDDLRAVVEFSNKPLPTNDPVFIELLKKSISGTAGNKQANKRGK